MVYWAWSWKSLWNISSQSGIFFSWLCTIQFTLVLFHYFIQHWYFLSLLMVVLAALYFFPVFWMKHWTISKAWTVLCLSVLSWWSIFMQARIVVSMIHGLISILNMNLTHHPRRTCIISFRVRTNFQIMQNIVCYYYLFFQVGWEVVSLTPGVGMTRTGCQI